MKNNFHQSTKKKIGSIILNNLFEIKGVISATITGSYSDSNNLEQVNDIDVVVISQKLDRKIFYKCKNKLKLIKEKIILKKNKKLLINTTFGPLKFDTEKNLVIHLMIYDINTHKQHTINSPFTCLDWERSNFFLGKSLKEISPVFRLQYRDFFEARRNVNEYIKEISNLNISYRKYEFIKGKVSLVKKFFKIDKRNKGEFTYHIIKNLIMNLIKFENNDNFYVNVTLIEKKFSEITIKNEFLIKQYKKLCEDKFNKKSAYSDDVIILAKFFIKYYNAYLDKLIEFKEKKFFMRHQKTFLNDGTFFGQKRDSNIIKTKITPKIQKIKFDKCYSSPLKRSLQTAELLIDKNKIKKDRNLKEIDYGNAEGLNYIQFKKKYPEIIKLWKKNLDPNFPKGENTEKVKKRLLNFVKSKLENKKKKNYDQYLLVVTHNVILRCLLGHYLNFKKKYWYLIKINNLDYFEFINFNGRIRTNIKRKQFIKIFSKIDYLNN